ncbi:alpha/beta hydrolase-fold protein [Spirosoma koreense]
MLVAQPSFGQTESTKKPFVLGIIDAIESKALGQTRTLNIYLPPGYSKDSMNRYPVIYLLDGSADEDFIHIAGLVQFANFPWVNLLPKSIVVGIANIDRRHDFTFPTTIAKDKTDFPTTGHSQAFIAFLEKELQPYIQKNYSAHPARTLIGQSLGGLLATEILFEKPTLFNSYIIVSPSLWWDNESLLKGRAACLDSSFTQRTRVYIAVGKEGAVMEGDARQLVDRLKKAPHSAMQVSFDYFGDENHATIFHQAVYKAFERFSKPL